MIKTKQDAADFLNSFNYWDIIDGEYNFTYFTGKHSWGIGKIELVNNNGNWKIYNWGKYYEELKRHFDFMVDLVYSDRKYINKKLRYSLPDKDLD